MINLYFINDGSNSNSGWCTSIRDAKATRASLIRAYGEGYVDTDIETYSVPSMSTSMLQSIAGSTRTPVPARRVAQRELTRRGE